MKTEILCISNFGFEDELTVGKTYAMIWENDTTLITVNDSGEAASFPPTLFVACSPVDSICAHCGVHFSNT